MRTTLTLDDDVAALLGRVRETRKMSLKQAVNEGLRQGLSHLVAPPSPQEPYRTRSVWAGRCLVENVDNVAEVLAFAEGDWHR